jgi:dTDP-glucose pyrophosphorylase
MRINLIPMAGEGQRFKNAAYNIPKPLLMVNGLPMVVRAAKSLPPADRYIFVCQQKHLSFFPIEDVLKQHFDDVKVIGLDSTTEGQAITCMMAKDYIPADAFLTIGASDNDMLYNAAEFEKRLENSDTDAWIWTFRNNPLVLKNPSSYGWVDIKESNGSAAKISCKNPISDKPLNDHAIIGAFSFKRASIFFDAVSNMVEHQAKINGEYYVDIALEFAIRMGFKVNVFEVDQYICWGTPEDYQEYLFWLRYFKKQNLASH